MKMEKVTVPEKTATGVAHSKLILVGEHAVVHGQPAIAIPFPLIKAESHIEPIDGGIYLESSLYKGLIEHAPKALFGIVHTIKHTLKLLEIPYKDLFIRVNSTIPPGKGLGSSASVAISIIKALFSYVDKPYTNEQLLDLANISEKYAHGAPSGLDPLTITSTSPIWYKKEEPIDYIRPKGDFHFVVVDSGEMADTKTAVSNVRQLVEESPKIANEKIERLGQITYEMRESLEQASVELLGRLLNEAQKNLQAIGVSNGTLNKLINFVREEGALGAKLTGGGNGGCIIALAQSDLHSKKLTEKLKQYGVEKVWPFVLSSES